MPGDLTLSLGTLYGFLTVLARIAGALIFVPLPGIRSTPEPVRAVLVLAFTVVLFPRWPVVDAGSVTPATLAGWACGEAALGLAIGVSMAMVLEVFSFAAQVLGLQAGYAYASTIDPNTQADSGVLLVFAQLAAGLLFFAVGLDRDVLRLFARSLDRIPPGAYRLSLHSAQNVVQLGAGLFSTGLRLAMPVVALLILVDVALALLGRLNTQLQLLSLAFPIKMLAALVVLSWGAALFPRILLEFSGRALAVARHLLSL